MMNFRTTDDEKKSSFIICHSSLEHAILEFQRVKRQLLPIHPGIAAAKVRRLAEVDKCLCTKVLTSARPVGQEYATLT